MTKVCSNKNCNDTHNTKYKQCSTCRSVFRNYRRRKGNYKVSRIIDICEKNIALEPCKQILRIINENKQ